MSAASPDVLVIDDDPMVLSLMRRRLRGSAATLRTCAWPREAGEARECLRAGGVRLLLVDLRMHGTDGLELIAQLDREALLDGVRAVLCTSAEPGADVRGRIEALGRELALKDRLREPGAVERLLAGGDAIGAGPGRTAGGTPYPSSSIAGATGASSHAERPGPRAAEREASGAPVPAPPGHVPSRSRA